MEEYLKLNKIVESDNGEYESDKICKLTKIRKTSKLVNDEHLIDEQETFELLLKEKSQSFRVFVFDIIKHIEQDELNDIADKIINKAMAENNDTEISAPLVKKEPGEKSKSPKKAAATKVTVISGDENNTDTDKEEDIVILVYNKKTQMYSVEEVVKSEVCEVLLEFGVDNKRLFVKEFKKLLKQNVNTVFKSLSSIYCDDKHFIIDCFNIAYSVSEDGVELMTGEVTE